jgi:cbb3-type cytochrome c oxidase subunit II
MPDRHDNSGWRGVALVAVTYVYFLIFAQFAFLSRLAELHLAATSLKIIMAAMAAGGVLLSLIAPRAPFVASPAHRLRIAFAACAAAALLSVLPLSHLAAVTVSFLIGAALGLLTVTLVTHLRAFAGNRNPILKVGLGTGIGYFLCNVPAFFTATPQTQTIVAAALCLIGIGLASNPSEQTPSPIPPRSSQFSLPRALATFAALVWLDSAAFYIIQHTPALKSGTWLGSAHLWTNACLHLAAAIASAWLLQQRRSGIVLSAAFIALGFACFLLRNPALALPASLFYPIGVALYSVALVAYPSFLSSATSIRERGIQAGWIYALAGWIGSALGIGMGQNLGHVPTAIVVVAGTIVLLPAFLQLCQTRTREVVALAVTLTAAFVIYRLLPTHSASSQLSAVERGRRVYIGEGCIHCHSQYVRPNSPDVLMWGPIEDLREVHAQQPPLIGNRRQGPDLTQVGARRSPLWLKAHLIHPSQVTGGSVMPSFAHLFRDQRGDDLVTYLASLHSGDAQHQRGQEQSWQPSAAAASLADPAEGQILYEHQCATCHDANGLTRIEYQSQFTQSPANIFTGPFKYLPSSPSVADRSAPLSRISKFGIPGTDMPGHEYLSDQQIASLALYLMQRSSTSVHN